MEPQRAVIDIGSNTVRLVIYGGPPRAPAVLFNEKVTARLGRGLSETGVLAPKAMTSALAGLARFAAILRLRGLSDVQTVATAAPRDAANGPEFLDAVRRLGLEPLLLSGEEEAQTSARGVIAAFPGARGVVADLGGGSLELIAIADGDCGQGVSLPLGSLRLAAMRQTEGRRFAGKLGKRLPDGICRGQEGLPLYLVGGSHRALAHYAIEQAQWPLDDPHGFTLDPAEALRHCRAISRSGVPAVIPGVSASRRLALPNTAALMTVLIRRLQPSRLVFSSWGLREGLLHAALGPDQRDADPLLAGVTAFAARQGVATQTATRMAAWIAGAMPGADPQDERLRLASAMLALALQRVEPNLRAAEALHWALRKRWIGIDAPGRAMIASALLAQIGRTGIADELLRLCPRDALQRAQSWGAALRLCRRFSVLSATALGASRIGIANGRLVLAFHPSLQVLATDAVARDLRLLAGLLGLESELRPDPGITARR